MSEDKPDKPKLSKAERREKQRAQNLLRAQKMHQARLAFTPEEPVALARPERRFEIGCSGWFYWDWRNCFYTDNMPTSEWFGHYRAHFDTVELNAPFYGWPTVATVKGWRRQVEGTDFVYTIKVSELITHIKRFENTKTLIRDFGLIADLLGPHMGCLLYQLPPSYHYSLARLKNIIGQLDLSRRNVLEFRHASWWNDDVYKSCREANVIFCSCSAPKLPDRLIQTAPEIYIRFHGPEKWYRYDYSRAELQHWAQQIKECDAKRVWAYFNNDYDCHAINNAQTLRKILSGD